MTDRPSCRISKIRLKPKTGFLLGNVKPDLLKMDGAYFRKVAADTWERITILQYVRALR